MYVDHAATTPVRPEVQEVMLSHHAECWGNPSSLHGPGRRARQALDQARRDVAEVFGCGADEVVFTGSGSEGANLAIQGVAFAAGGGRNHLITTRVEHHAVLDTCKYLASRFGFEATYLEVDRCGRIDPEQLERAITDRTALVSIMYANNEVGTIQPIQEIARVAHARGVPVHTDAVQAAGSLSLDVETLGVDLISIAAHKLGGPKGVGALYVRRGTPLLAQVRGGGQERGRRSGTENIPAVVGMASALSLVQSAREQAGQQHRSMTNRLLEQLPARTPGTVITGDPVERLPNHASVAFKDVEIASILLGLDRQEIWASSGSACTSRSSEPSHVLVAMGVPRANLFGALRLTFGLGNEPADVDTLLDAIPSLVASARQAAA